MCNARKAVDELIKRYEAIMEDLEREEESAIFSDDEIYLTDFRCRKYRTTDFLEDLKYIRREFD